MFEPSTQYLPIKSSVSFFFLYEKYLKIELNIYVNANMSMKVCASCKKEKNVKEFGKNNQTKDNLRIYCKNCEKKYKNKIKNREKIKVDEKKCNVCKITKDIHKFHLSSYTIDGHHRTCKECTSKRGKITNQKHWIRQLVHDSRKKDKKRGFDIKNLITKIFIKKQLELQENKCYYCDCNLKFGIGVNRKKGDGLTLERIDTNQGHTKSNCIFICYECNVMKRDINFKKFIKKCLKIGKKFQYIIDC